MDPSPSPSLDEEADALNRSTDSLTGSLRRINSEHPFHATHRPLSRKGSYSDPTQKIHLIDFEAFAAREEMPRYPEDRALCQDLKDVDRDNALVVFISHSWLRGAPAADGWNGRPHPDNAEHEKFRLCRSGVQKIWDSMAPDM